MVSPASTRPLPLVSTGVPAVLTRPMVAAALVATELVSLAVVAAPVGGVPVAVAVLDTLPESTSAWVITYGAAVHVVEAPGASVLAGQLMPVTLGSVTPTAVSVTSPVLVTRNE